MIYDCMWLLSKKRNETRRGLHDLVGRSLLRKKGWGWVGWATDLFIHLSPDHTHVRIFTQSILYSFLFCCWVHASTWHYVTSYNFWPVPHSLQDRTVLVREHACHKCRASCGPWFQVMLSPVLPLQCTITRGTLRFMLCTITLLCLQFSWMILVVTTPCTNIYILFNLPSLRSSYTSLYCHIGG
jgi:hypothetical protein